MSASNACTPKADAYGLGEVKRFSDGVVIEGDALWERIMERPEVTRFVQDFRIWNEEVLWLVTSCSIPYIGMQNNLGSMLAPYVGDSLLDLGSGNGAFAARLLEALSPREITIYAMDVDRYSLRSAHDKIRKSNFSGLLNLRLIEGSTWTRLPFPTNSLGCVTSSLGGLTYASWWFEFDGGNPVCVAERRVALRQCLREIARVLKPGGILAFSSVLPNPDWHKVLRESLSQCVKTISMIKLYKALRYGPRAARCSRFMNAYEADGFSHYLSVEEWQKELKDAGFEVIQANSGECYAGQGVLVLAQSEVE